MGLTTADWRRFLVTESEDRVQVCDKCMGTHVSRQLSLFSCFFTTRKLVSKFSLFISFSQYYKPKTLKSPDNQPEDGLNHNSVTTFSSLELSSFVCVDLKVTRAVVEDSHSLSLLYFCPIYRTDNRDRYRRRILSEC